MKKSIIHYIKINPLVPDAHYSERRDRLASLRSQTTKSQLVIKWRIFMFFTPGTSGLK